MVVNLVLKLSDGEELVVESLEDDGALEDPRERTTEVCREVQTLEEPKLGRSES